MNNAPATQERNALLEKVSVDDLLAALRLCTRTIHPVNRLWERFEGFYDETDARKRALFDQLVHEGKLPEALKYAQDHDVAGPKERKSIAQVHANYLASKDRLGDALGVAREYELTALAKKLAERIVRNALENRHDMGTPLKLIKEGLIQDPSLVDAVVHAAYRQFVHDPHQNGSLPQLINGFANHFSEADKVLALALSKD